MSWGTSFGSETQPHRTTSPLHTANWATSGEPFNGGDVRLAPTTEMHGLRSVTVFSTGRDSPGSDRPPSGPIEVPSGPTTQPSTVARKLNIILLSRSSIVVTHGTVEKSKVCSVGPLKTATILKRPISSSKLARKSHREFAVAVEGWHVGLGGKTHCPLHHRPGSRPTRKG